MSNIITGAERGSAPIEGLPFRISSRCEFRTAKRRWRKWMIRDGRLSPVVRRVGEAVAASIADRSGYRTLLEPDRIAAEIGLPAPLIVWAARQLEAAGWLRREFLCRGARFALVLAAPVDLLDEIAPRRAPWVGDPSEDDLVVEDEL